MLCRFHPWISVESLSHCNQVSSPSGYGWIGFTVTSAGFDIWYWWLGSWCCSLCYLLRSLWPSSRTAGIRPQSFLVPGASTLFINHWPRWGGTRAWKKIKIKMYLFCPWAGLLVGCVKKYIPLSTESNVNGDGGITLPSSQQPMAGYAAENTTVRWLLGLLAPKLTVCTTGCCGWQFSSCPQCKQNWLCCIGIDNNRCPACPTPRLEFDPGD